MKRKKILVDADLIRLAFRRLDFFEHLTDAEEKLLIKLENMKKKEEKKNG